jgi:hypothetical protein
VFLRIGLTLKFKKKYNIFFSSRNNKNNFETEKFTGWASVPKDASKYKIKD